MAKERVDDRTNEKTDEKIMMKEKDDGMKMTSKEVSTRKKKVMKNVNDELNIRVRKVVRKTRSDGLLIETANENDVRMLHEYKK